MTTIVEDWDDLKDRLGTDHAANADDLFNMGDRLADAVDQMAEALWRMITEDGNAVETARAALIAAGYEVK